MADETPKVEEAKEEVVTVARTAEDVNADLHKLGVERLRQMKSLDTRKRTLLKEFEEKRQALREELASLS